MRNPRFFARAISVVLPCTMALPLAAALAVPPDMAVPACLLHARINDPDPAGTHVRAGPSASAPVVALLPHART